MTTAPARLTTPWTAEVGPHSVHREYPRPQLVREEWECLNGLWDWAIGEAPSPEPRLETTAAVTAGLPSPAKWDGKILVPFPVESALSGVGKPVGPGKILWYRRRFDVPAAWAGRRVLVHFGAVDWEARVIVNGREAGIHRGGYDGFSFDVTDYLVAGSAQEIQVACWDPTDSGVQPRGKQVMRPEGIWYTAVTGIWQTVWIEPVPAEGIDSLALVPDPDRGVLRLTVVAGAGELEATAYRGGAEVGRARGRAGAEFEVPVPDPVRWSPSSPTLYDLEVTLLRDGRIQDRVRSYFGMRTIAARCDGPGVMRIELNGEPLFQAGPLDQGFWPDGIYTAPSDEALRRDVETMKALGFNMARKHVKVEPDRWYYWCDRLGLLVWQDFPSGDGFVKESPEGSGEVREVPRSPASAAVYERELEAMIAGLGNHPSIVMWVPFNEGWGQFDTVRILNRVKSLDPSRLVDGSSGWNHFPAGDAIDAHVYPGPGAPPKVSDRAMVLGEFGGLGLRVEGHCWAAASWGYEGMKDRDALSVRLQGLWAEVARLKTGAGLSAAVYTQLTDVELECNGLLTYDRKVLKVDAAAHADWLGKVIRD